ncbi:MULTISPECIES: histidine kinase [unclassified Kocuria]|uniref:sensor histidine kinase n=1 Tax=unclassified Kocuria TaxID=2649579 RepID=UPI002882EB76|nr:MULTISPECIES: histidine kinase [unclassified Kocuria]
MQLHHRVADWLRTHSAWTNALFLLALAAFTVLVTVSSPAQMACSLALIAVLVLRPLRPALSAALFALVSVVATVVLGVFPLGIGLLGVPWLLYTVASRCRRRTRLSLLALALLVAAIVSASWPGWRLGAPLSSGAAEVTLTEWAIGAASQGIMMMLIIVASYLAGDLHRVTLQRREAEAHRAEALAERARRLEVERDQEVRLAAQDERTRIAREMHDVVAHSLSVVIAQADGARYAVRSDPSVAADVLGTIATTARGSLSEMRSLLGVLRTDGEEAERAPVPTVQDLPALVDSVRSAGLDVDLQVHPADLPELPSGPSLAVYRLVQEGLTNTLKHAPQATAAQVRLNHDGSDLVVQIRSDGRIAGPDPEVTAPPSGGQGLRGLGERLRLYGGEIEAGPDPADTRHWVLTGWLPLAAAVDESSHHDPGTRTARTPQEDTR